MTLLGQTRQDLPFPFCTNFHPTVLEGQLCYSLDLESLKTSVPPKMGKEHGLLLILDANQYEEDKVDLDNEDISFDSLSLTTKKSVGSSARIYINTMASFTDYGSGSYAMSSLKKMTGTENFLALQNKPCHIEVFEDCQARSYTQEVKKKCGCTPWTLAMNLTIQV